ncbi:NFACT RNA binding domain-containing protein [Hymenobacter sp. H14-R3]|uniref:NFACT RNA binding domain-containing protein n=1 Tax=Hymenobacter sp. H14-R3 TaxID=3046308 RepID=UPI0024BB2282|nr:NFACT RNA binding domain-containing protein [Hymenobacter sp. H14-R3]MDJ0366979.1 NFACT RNA binding domain-containing protein [Hymenobacter sp. H14-R3]
MHTNYYFLRQLAPALTAQLRGYRVASCFSQEKDELVIGLLSETGTEFWLKAQLGAAFPALALPETFHRARQNSVDLLPELLGRTVAQVTVWPQDRVLQFTFTEDGATLVFKLYGPRPNAIFRPAPGAPAQLFHQRYATDADLGPSPADAPAPPVGPTGKLPPALADLPARFLREQRGYAAASLPQQQQLADALRLELENPAHYYVIYLDGRTRLSLVPLGELLATLPSADPIGALRRFVPLALARRALETERRQLRQLLTRRADEAGTSAHLAGQRLHALAHEAGYRHRADLIMAHLHAIAPGTAQLEVIDFYTNEPVVLKLKPLEKPQRTAENLYRKAKNQQIEERQLQGRINSREAEALQALELLEELDAQPALAELRGLRAWRKQHALDPTPAATKAATELPFKVFEDQGFTILVGRNAQNNDLLTQKYAHKDDLWLHAKDVSGSHVVIRHRAGQPVPEPVVEHAAQLAGWYSRRQHDSLCPVTVTPKKFVRKPKGARPGQVLVERERVVLVVPGNPFENVA